MSFRPSLNRESGGVPVVAELQRDRLPYLRGESKEGYDMRSLIFYSIAAMLITAPMATAVKAEDTTIIKRDHDGDRKVIEKRERTNVLPVPHTEEKTIIKKERD
jgi:hypothetical protein